MATFQEAYKKLNPAQKEAVDTIEGPVVVVAGPGTGKTQILTLRIANIIKKTDTPPDGILALTFTESGVYSMRKRLLDMIGGAAYQVGIYTFHGFANDVIRRYPDAFPRIIGASQIDDVDRVLLFKEIIEDVPLRRLRPLGDPFYHLHSIRSKISELKRENISPEKLRERIEKQKTYYAEIPDLKYDTGRYKGQIKGKYADLSKHIEKNEDLLLIFERYETALRTMRLFDYEDMIIEVIRALENDKELLLTLQEQYLYFLADEHQDANNAQNRLLELLASFHESPNLFIVGDAKQAIYRFQGASLENFLYFRERYPTASNVALSDNYRSIQPILDAAHALAEKSAIPKDLVVPLKGHREHPREQSSPEIISFARPEDELLYVTREVKRLIASGVPGEEIAVLYRTNRDAAPVSLMFEKHDVPFVVESDQNILGDPAIRKFIALLKAGSEIGGYRALIDALHADFLDIPSIALYQFVRKGDRSHPKLVTAIEMIERYAKEVPFRNPFEIAEGLARDSGFIASVLKSGESEDILEKVNSLFETLRGRLERHRDSTLADFVRYLDLINEHDLLIKKETRGERKGRVRCMTAHRSKGLEFDYVYIIGAADKHFGNRREITHFRIPITEGAPPFGEEGGSSNEDERRLFYVALTRARMHAVISFARENERGEAALASAFIGDLGSLSQTDAPPSEGSVTEALLDRLRPRRVVVPPAQDKEYLNRLFLEQGLSVTALDNYLGSPWQYFYQNLLRIPKTPVRHLLYGDAVHEALRYHFEAFKRGEADIAHTLQHFRSVLEQKPLPKAAFEESFARGTEALTLYIEKRKPHIVPFKTEWSIETPFIFSEGLVIPIRGKLDKVEMHPDGGLRVIDYKTGKAKSRAEIEGKTKNADGNLKRQLTFYKVLIEESGSSEQFRSGALDWIEADDKGRIRAPEEFSISDEETDMLREEIRRVAKEIYDLSFWDTVCDSDSCDYCDLVEAIQNPQKHSSPE